MRQVWRHQLSFFWLFTEIPQLKLIIIVLVVRCVIKQNSIYEMQVWKFRGNFNKFSSEPPTQFLSLFSFYGFSCLFVFQFFFFFGGAINNFFLCSICGNNFFFSCFVWFYTHFFYAIGQFLAGDLCLNVSLETFFVCCWYLVYSKKRIIHRMRIILVFMTCQKWMRDLNLSNL